MASSMPKVCPFCDAGDPTNYIPYHPPSECESGEEVPEFFTKYDADPAYPVFASSNMRMADVLGADRWRRLRLYTAALLHGQYREQAVIFDSECRHRHRSHEAAVNCAKRIALSLGVEAGDI